MMEAARSSETLVNFYQTTWCYNPEDSHRHTHCHENLKSYLDLTLLGSFAGVADGLGLEIQVLTQQGGKQAKICA
jgi:hypothetical protein